MCSGKVCTKPEYATYARCPDYYTTCEDTHPFHEAAKNKFGAPPAAWQALVDTLLLDNALKAAGVERAGDRLRIILKLKQTPATSVENSLWPTEPSLPTAPSPPVVA